MRLSLVSSVWMAGSCLAQGDLAKLLASQDDLSTLLELVGLVPGLAEKLSAASNITIVAPTNEAFKSIPMDTPEREAVDYKNDTIAIGALLANHVFKGVYPSSVITDIPTFAQTLLDDTYVNYRQPFSNFTGGQYNGLVKDGKDVKILSGEQTISTVVAADIKLGEGITIHKIDQALNFGAPLQLFTFRAGYTAMNAALEAGDLGLDITLTGADTPGQNISDYTIFVPENDAFKNIGSVLETADLKTLQAVLKYHIIPSNVIFSPSLGNVTVKSLQGDDLVITVLPDGSAWVNNAKITFPNTILFNGVAHVIDAVVAPGPFDRNSLKPSAPATERLAFPNATKEEKLPFTSVAFADLPNAMAYTSTPVLLKTMAAIATGSMATATPTSNLTASPSGPGLPESTGAGSGLLPGAVAALAVAVGVAAVFL